MKYISFILRVFIFYIIAFIVVWNIWSYISVFLHKKEGFAAAAAAAEGGIPRKVYQTWFSKTLPPLMETNRQSLIQKNPEMEFILFDDEECHAFIKENFDESVVTAYDTLVPGAYKADLWRYCVLYVNGGMYLDIKYDTVGEFKLTSLADKEHFVMDRGGTAEPGKKTVYNGFMVCRAKNPILLKCIEAIVENVKKRFYGYSPLSPTGPALLGNTMTEMGKMGDVDLQYSENGLFISQKNTPILKIYDEYREEQKKFKKNDYYGELWKNKRVYGEN